MNLSKELEDYFKTELLAYNSSHFNKEEAVQIAIELLEEEMEKSPSSHLKFHEKQWHLWFENSLSTRVIDFEKLRVAISTYSEMKVEEFETIVKCWLADLISTYSFNYVDEIYRYFLQFLKISEVFSMSKIDEVETYLSNKCSQRVQYDIAISTLNFIEFYEEIDKNFEYGTLLIDIRERNSPSNRGDSQRSLPPAREVLIFDWVVNDYFSKINKYSEEYLYYFPIYLWWNMTNIIPLRPAEFCDIKRDALHPENGEFFIKLPRNKNRKTVNGVQSVSEILISKELGEEIEHYKKETEKYGHCETLCHPYIRSKREIKTAFSTLKHAYVLQAFYKYIVLEEYKFKVKLNPQGEPTQCEKEEVNNYQITKPITPGDTRHFSMLNLMRQGYHPIEIQRLAGHSSLHSQRGYYNHLEYWVDVEVVELLEQVRADLDSEELNYIDQDFKNEHIVKFSEETFIPLDIGYCIEPNQDCPVENCFDCVFWRITDQDFLDNLEEIQAQFNKSHAHIKELIAVLANLQKVAFNYMDSEYEFSENDYLYNRDLNQIKQRLDLAIRKHSHFQSRFKWRNYFGT